MACTIGGQAASVQSTAAAPGLAGVLQITVQIPSRRFRQVRLFR
jgi:uncharacterized protein (TIGR03437 family)